MDFMEGLPESHGYHMLTVVMDCYSKYVHFILLKHHISTKQVAKEFIKGVMGFIGFP